jgi:hypothetical protein
MSPTRFSTLALVFIVRSAIHFENTLLVYILPPNIVTETSSFLAFNELCTVLSSDQWIQILSLHSIPAVRCYAAWALARRWTKLTDGEREKVFFLAMTDAFGAIGMSGCMFTMDTPAMALLKRIDEPIDKKFELFLARRLQDGDAWRKSIQRPKDPRVIQNMRLPEAQMSQGTLDVHLEKRLNAPLRLSEILKFEELIPLSQYAQFSREKLEDLILDELKSLQTVPEGWPELDDISTTHFSLPGIVSAMITLGPCPLFKDVLVELSKNDRFSQRASDELFKMVLPYCLDDDEMLEVVFRLLERTQKDWTYGSTSHQLDRFIAAYLQDSSLSSLAADKCAMYNRSKQEERQLAPEAQRKLERASRFWSLIDFMVDKLNKATFPGLETTKFLLKARRDSFGPEKFKSIFFKVHLGSDSFLPNLVAAIDQMDDVDYRKHLLNALKDAVLSSQDQLENVCCVYSTLLSTDLLEDILPRALEYALKLASTTFETMDCLHILRACLQAKQYDSFQQLLSAITDNTMNADPVAQVLARIANEMTRLASE